MNEVSTNILAILAQVTVQFSVLSLCLCDHRRLQMSWPSAALVLALLSATDTASARPERREVEVQADGAAKPHEGRTKDTIE